MHTHTPVQATHTRTHTHIQATGSLQVRAALANLPSQSPPAGPGGAGGAGRAAVPNFESLAAAD